ncbi:MAG: hypothetical protein LBT04_04445 [Prevotellaceae bacterium]|jgi:hypothetical protein|nr:hypothetical protein [Prevotellaceae bacterium]
MAKIVLYPLRTLGIPATIDFVRNWGNSTGAHAWDVVWTKEKMVAFMGLEQLPYEYNPFSIYPDSLTSIRFPAKVFRKTFSINKEIETWKEGLSSQDIPIILKDNKIKDVSDEYFPVTDIHWIALRESISDSLVYLSVYEDDWKLAYAAKNRKNKTVVFKQMKREMLYLPSVYRSGQVIPVDVPLTVDACGRTKRLQADVDKKISFTITSLYPALMEKIYALDHQDELPKDIFKRIDAGSFRRKPVNGEVYQLQYWKNGCWQICAKNEAVENKLVFKNIPSQALYILTGSNGKPLGRCFTLENGKQIFW